MVFYITHVHVRKKVIINMRIVFEEKDIAFINSIEKDLSNENHEIPLLVNETDKTYKLSFNVTDIAKANVFLQCFLFRDEKFQSETGIKPLQLIFQDNREDIIRILEDTIRQLKQ